MLSVNTNVSALNAYRNLAISNDKQSQSMQRLSSGYRINSAADDAAGLAISTGMGSQISGMTQAVRNTQDGISVVQTASGALNEATSILQRMRDLAVQSANDSNDSTARGDITTEITQLQSELSRIADATKFNGIDLLKGGSLKFQVGANSTDATNAITVNLANLSTVASSVTSGGAGAKSYTVLKPSDVAGDFVFTNTPATGSASTATVAMGAAGDYKTVQQVADKLNGDASFSASMTAYVNKDNDLVVTSNNGGTVTGAAGTGAGSATAVTGGINLSTQVGAAAAIQTLDSAIQSVSTAQAQLGAYQNRFSHTINNLTTAIQNTTESQSRIRDTDMAQEMTNFSKSQILVQAGTAMLSQANSSSQSILKLLQG